MGSSVSHVETTRRHAGEPREGTRLCVTESRHFLLRGLILASRNNGRGVLDPQ
jgi:hypothetical protein